MTTPDLPIEAYRVIEDKQIAVVHCSESFILAPGTHLRATHCLICQQPIGNRPAGIIGVAAITGHPCPNGCIIADAFLVHTEHMPLDNTELEDALKRGLRCNTKHL